MEEREITLELRSYLKQEAWKIESIHFPGAQGGLSVSVEGKTRGWVPDLIAIKNKVVLTVESKTGYSEPDVNKLNGIFNDERYLEKLRMKLDLSHDTFIQKAIVFHSQSSQENQVPVDFVVFVVTGKNKVAISLGSKVHELVRDLLS